jgi:hypothetical protein
LFGLCVPGGCTFGFAEVFTFGFAEVSSAWYTQTQLQLFSAPITWEQLASLRICCTMLVDSVELGLILNIVLRRAFMSNQLPSSDVTSEDRLWALLAYILSPIVPIIILLIEDKKNRRLSVRLTFR